MATIILAGWREGLQKVSLTKLQQELLHLPLKEAKENVDQLLAGHKVLVEVADEVAVSFVQRASELGVLIRFSAASTNVQLAKDLQTPSQQAA